MTAILYLLGGSLVLGAAALAIFLWPMSDGHYDDMEGAANRILFDDDTGSMHKAVAPTTARAKNGSAHGASKP